VGLSEAHNRKIRSFSILDVRSQDVLICPV